MTWSAYSLKGFKTRRQRMKAPNVDSVLPPSLHFTGARSMAVSLEASFISGGSQRSRILVLFSEVIAAKRAFWVDPAGVSCAQGRDRQGSECNILGDSVSETKLGEGPPTLSHQAVLVGAPELV